MYKDSEDLKNFLESIRDEGNGYINIAKAFYILCEEVIALRKEVCLLKEKDSSISEIVNE